MNGAGQATSAAVNLGHDLDLVHQANADLGDRLDQFEQRLEHAMRPQMPPPETGPEKMDEPTRSPLSGVIRGAAQKLQSSVNRLDDMLGRLEL